MSKKNLHKLMTLILFFLTTVLYGQTIGTDAKQIEQPKRSERYAEAYKKYLSAACPITKDSIQHFVYFARDRESLINHPLLLHPMFKGAQIMYSWKDFEPKKGEYNFSILKQDYEYLNQYGKKIFIQLQT